jgi:hypothetical protein
MQLVLENIPHENVPATSQVVVYSLQRDWHEECYVIRNG